MPHRYPEEVRRQVIGIADRRYQETIAEALVGLGCERAMVVAAEDGLNEISIGARTRVIEVSGGSTEEWFVEPGDVGLEEADLEQVAGARLRKTRRRPAPCSPARAVRAVTSCCSTPARRSTWEAVPAR
jgi:anthranilate phosphoribosyltransferase